MTFVGALNTNEVFASLYNMIISLQVFDAGISGLENEIYSKRRVDGTMYGDTKLYVSTDMLKTYAWDGTDTPGGYNLLTLHRPPTPAEDAIIIDQYRQIPVTVDEYLTKKAFEGEGSFSQFNGVILSWLYMTKEMYEHTYFTSNLIVSALANAKSYATITLHTAPTNVAGYDAIKWRAQEMFRILADKLKELKEPSRSYNDLGFMRNYNADNFDIVVPLGVLSQVEVHDIPFLFNPDVKVSIKEVHWKYFGAINGTADSTAASNTTVRSLIETDYGTPAVHVMPGDLLPNSTAYAKNTTYTATYTATPTWGADFPILLINKRDYPIMSAFTVGTSFFNARNLNTNHYLTFGHNKVYDAHLREHALLKITVDLTA